MAKLTWTLLVMKAMVHLIIPPSRHALHKSQGKLRVTYYMRSRQVQGDSRQASSNKFLILTFSLNTYGIVRDGSATQLLPGPPSQDRLTPSTLQMNSPPTTSDTTTGRQSVMSVHNLIAPTTGEYLLS